MGRGTMQKGPQVVVALIAWVWGPRPGDETPLEREMQILPSSSQGPGRQQRAQPHGHPKPAGS